MGPSVKFVSPNKGLISKKKIGVNFFRVKNDQTGGPRAVWQKTTLFHVFFFLNLPLINIVDKNIEYQILRKVLRENQDIPLVESPPGY